VGDEHVGRRLVVTVAGLLLVSLIALHQNVDGTAAAIVAAGLIPPAGFAAVVLLLGRRAAIPWSPLLAALLWGASAAALAAQLVNDAALQALSRQLVTPLVGPLVEEAAKASALLFVVLVWPRILRGAREGIVLGALAGLGFAATENIGYYMLAAVQGGEPGLARALYVRGLLEGLNHAAFSAIVGAAAGHARAVAEPATRRRATVAAGFGVAVAVHGTWNAVASSAITSLLCNAPADGAACAPAPRPFDLLVSVPMLIAAFIGPLAALLVALALRDHRSR
jgi:RsiW-degrading membrane proteinase PrsW (M82 family)